MNERHTYEFINNEVEERGGRLITKEYRNGKQNLEIVGLCGHSFSLPWNKIISGRWCGICAIERRNASFRTSLDTVKCLIASRGGLLLSETYKNGKCKLMIKGECGHTFSSTWTAIKNKGRWCQECSGGTRLGIQHIRNEIEARGGTMISESYINSVTPITIKCGKCNTIWDMTWDKIKQNHWCIGCGRYKRQKRALSIIKCIFSNQEAYLNYNAFSWLYNQRTRGTQSLDICIPTLKLAIECDGEQHFRPVRFGGMSEEKAKIVFKRTKLRDRLKNKKVAKHPEDIQFFIRIKYDEPLTKEHITARLVEAGIIKE
jgi:hypothetical protein